MKMMHNNLLHDQQENVWMPIRAMKLDFDVYISYSFNDDLKLQFEFDLPDNHCICELSSVAEKYLISVIIK